MAKTKRKQKYPIIKNVKLNNKSRKGAYVYIKLEKGGKPSYYKKKKGLIKADYLETKKFGIVAKKKGAKPRSVVEKYLKKVKRGKQVEEILQKGVTEVDIKNVERLTAYGIRSAYMSLLTNKQKGYKGAIVKDKLLAEILSRPENVAKFKHRIEYKIDLIGTKGEILATLISAHKGKTLEEIKRDMKVLNIGQEIQGEYNLKGFERYNISRKSKGRLKSINIKMIFRKG